MEKGAVMKISERAPFKVFLQVPPSEGKKASPRAKIEKLKMKKFLKYNFTLN
jgi:hypothetical protein